MRKNRLWISKSICWVKENGAGNTMILEEDDSIKMALHGNVIIARPKIVLI